MEKDKYLFLREFCILNEGGTIIFYKNDKNSESIENQNLLIKLSYLSAILQFSNKLTDGKLISSFEFQKRRVFIKKGILIPITYVYLIRTKLKIKKRKINKQMALVAKEFENRFSKFDLDEWDGSIDFFSSFHEHISKIIKF